MMDQRLEALEKWVQNQLGERAYQIEPASADASFRRYFRVTTIHEEGEQSRIVMDAPPDREETAPFIAIAETLRECGVEAPEVFAIEGHQGYLLLSDLGSQSYLDQLSRETVEPLYTEAMASLLQLQSRWPDSHRLPEYDHQLLLNEMNLFPEWYLQQHCEMNLTTQQHNLLQSQFKQLAESALQQPKVAVHRDYHSRNLMVIRAGQPGVIDFQDAVMGPITYDLVSLLRDCYIDWPREDVERWARHYYLELNRAALIHAITWEQFLQWFDWMGVQRHLKAVGIFARLNHRDGKPGYLNDIPRTLGYLLEVTGRYDELSELHQLLETL
ncbi:MAG: phosphotransferase [Gammaproteobacteria bacterium]|nr:phosphotransferase [Gammaproteobacteria bacterium]MBT3489779.1 phosphotransferase [Gammaproteobacteria bacterium]MBT3718010.1 phosphotransferase [Gammaproteobacteria bacterium]MBT3843799.1 phosphotransferase [Gammaproteobacteria bacterium]MBT3893706.1 phosphotransferase [Gammaproteobacteria bacterium]